MLKKEKKKKTKILKKKMKDDNFNYRFICLSSFIF